MRTVENLIKELHKFPLKAECFAYEGEFSGIVIQDDGDDDLLSSSGVIYCGERGEDRETEMLPQRPRVRNEPDTTTKTYQAKIHGIDAGEWGMDAQTCHRSTVIYGQPWGNP